MFRRATSRRFIKEKRQTLTGEALTSQKGKPDYGAQRKQGIQSRYGKSKGEPVNSRKQGELHEPSNDRV